MAQTLEGSRLKDVTIVGRSLSTGMVEACVSASVGLSRNNVTEMSLTFADTPDAEYFRTGVLAAGANIDYGGWRMVIDDMNVGPGPIGPSVTVKAPSRFVAELKKQRGEKSWGTVNVSSWMEQIAKSVGYKTRIQPGLGSQEVLRAGPTDQGPGQNSWELMADVAAVAGAWLFEVRDTLVFAKPTWLRSNAIRKVGLYWNNWFDYSDALAGMPQFHGSGAGEKQTLSLGLLATDADEITPGDIVSLTGQGVADMGGTWIVESVAFPMSVAGPVTLQCVRVNDPEPRAPTATSSTETDATSPLGVGATNWGSGNFTQADFGGVNIDWPVFYVPGSAYDAIMRVLGKVKEQSDEHAATVGVASVDAFVKKYTGVALDYDGAFGAQCVDLSAYYIREVVGVTPALGNGKDIYYNQNEGVTKIPGAGTCKPGDIISWGSSMGGGYGHVAVALADQGGSILCFSQNPGPCHQEVITKAGVIGYLRPNRAL